jgi:hypothetical protein
VEVLKHRLCLQEITTLDREICEVDQVREYILGTCDSVDLESSLVVTITRWKIAK